MTSYRRRFQRLTTTDQMYLKRQKRTILLLLAMYINEDDDDISDLYKLATLLRLHLYRQKQKLKFNLFWSPDPTEARTINSFHPDDCYIRFHFNREDLKRLMKAFKIPEVAVIMVYWHLILTTLLQL